MRKVQFEVLALFAFSPGLILMATLSAAHIRLDDRNIAWLDDTNIKVIEVASERIAHWSSAEEICDQHDGLLTLGQVHAALSHYYDHQSEYDREIDEQLRDYNTRRAAASDSPGRKRLRALGKLR